VTRDLSTLTAGSAERFGPSVVGLRGEARGTGIVIAEQRVLTTAANLGGDGAEVVFDDGRAESAIVTGLDRRRGLAVLTVDTDGRVPLQFGSADHGIGAVVVALANPWGHALSAAPGFVASRRQRPLGLAHTAPCPRGAGGGPLIDSAGALVGVNATRLAGGFILAIATDAGTRARVATLAAAEQRSDRTLGVAIAPAREARRLRRAVGLEPRDGLLVRAVAPDSAASRAGIQHGDLIVAVGAAPIATVDDLLTHLERGVETLEVTVLRGAGELALTASLTP
jgi:S1-C subfamily serine protease